MNNLINISDNEYIGCNNDFVIFGVGEIGNLVYKYLKRIKKRVVAFCDSDSNKWNTRIHGIKVYCPQLCAKKYSEVPFVVANQMHYEEMISVLRNFKIDKIVLCNRLYEIKNLYILAGKYELENKFYIYDRPINSDFFHKLNSFSFFVKGFFDKCAMYNEYKRNNTERKKKYQVSLCLIFYNEGPYLKEWIEYHKIIGIDHFYLYNHESTDNSMEILQPYIESGLVDVILWKDRIGQMTAYIDCANKHRFDSEWIGFIDTDEFIVPIEDNNIKDFLNKFKHRGSVLINWKCFGYNGKLTRNKNSLITEDFTQTSKKYNQLGKCFWNTRFAYKDNAPEDMMQIHYLHTIGENGKVYPLVNCFDIVCNEEYQFAFKDVFPIQINHYMHKSYNEYCERKKNGSATTEESYRNIHQFYQDESMIDQHDKRIFRYLGKLKESLFIE